VHGLAPLARQCACRRAAGRPGHAPQAGALGYQGGWLRRWVAAAQGWLRRERGKRPPRAGARPAAAPCAGGRARMRAAAPLQHHLLLSRGCCPAGGGGAAADAAPARLHGAHRARGGGRAARWGARSPALAASCTSRLHPARAAAALLASRVLAPPLPLTDEQPPAAPRSQPGEAGQLHVRHL
jgi:hypothetical protein